MLDRFVRQSDHARTVGCRLSSGLEDKERMRSHLKGQTYVEFAFSAVVVIMLIFALVNFSLALYAYNFVSMQHGKAPVLRRFMEVLTLRPRTAPT